MIRISRVPQCTIFLFIICSFEEATTSLFSSSNLEIEIPQGKVKGSYSWFDNQNTFLGIPYASVTERFEEPGRPPTWNGTFNANRDGIKCNQYLSALGTPVGQEDCLVLNIFTPPSLNEPPLPVMVFIYGGGFYQGYNTKLLYNPRYLVEKNVIFVTINYRLGAFGFLCLGLEEAPGNAGLKDQLAALKWIKNNIAYFGGDPSSVTLVGESVGAASANYLLLNDEAKGLFHKVILQSGTVMMPQAFIYNPVESASKVASSLGYNTSDPKELLNIFKNSTADDIVRASNFDQRNDVFAPYLFKPCAESATSRKPFLTIEPTELLKNISLNIPVIIGYNDREGINWATHYDAFRTLEKVKKNFDHIIPNYLQFERKSDKISFSNSIFQMYFWNSTATNGLIEYFSDSLIAYPSIFTSEAFIKASNRSVYNYYFEYDSARNLNKFLTRLPKAPGACHADELFYLFNPAIYYILPTLPNDKAMINTMTQLWTSFAKTGIPSGVDSTWIPSEGQLNFLEINNNLKMISLPNKERMKFWRQTFVKYGRRQG